MKYNQYNQRAIKNKSRINNYILDKTVKRKKNVFSLIELQNIEVNIVKKKRVDVKFEQRKKKKKETKRE